MPQKNNQDTSMSYYRTAEHRRLRAELIQSWKPWNQPERQRVSLHARATHPKVARSTLRALAKLLSTALLALELSVASP